MTLISTMLDLVLSSTDIYEFIAWMAEQGTSSDGDVNGNTTPSGVLRQARRF